MMVINDQGMAISLILEGRSGEWYNRWVALVKPVAWAWLIATKVCGLLLHAGYPGFDDAARTSRAGRPAEKRGRLGKLCMKPASAGKILW